MASYDPEHWRAGFEIEVALGDLGEERFAEYLDNPMDEATPAYCQAVARHLTNATGVRWSAPRGPRPKPGFYVVPEYDLDPTHWRDLVAGVELTTPPLRLPEADRMREKIAEAIMDLDGWANTDRDFALGFGWHINIDKPGTRGPNAARYAVGVDENAMLRVSGRTGSPYTGLQRHSYGVPLLRYLRIGGARYVERSFENFLFCSLDHGKSFAANFQRDRYVEFRHYGTPEFLEGPSLETLIGPAIEAFEMSNDAFRAAAAHTIQVFEVLRAWTDAIGPRIEVQLESRKRMIGEFGRVHFDGEPAGWLSWDGSAELAIEGDKEWHQAAVVRGLHLTDLHDGLALAALDIVEARRARVPTRLRSPGVSAAIDDLRRRLAAKRLLTRPSIASRRTTVADAEPGPIE
jgi:hypothetical protein